MGYGIAVAPCGLCKGRDDNVPGSRATYFFLKPTPRSGESRVDDVQRSQRDPSIPMHRLHLLGRVALERISGFADGPASRPRPMALLAVLAAAGKVGLGRDKALVYLWPESDTRRARNSLHQTLHAIRKDLGPDVVDSGPPLTLSPEHVAVDLWEFDAALSRGDLQTATALYAGPFLDGFSLTDLPELEEWIEQERLRIARRYAVALERSARRAAERGDHTHALHEWRALVRIDPLSAPPTLGLLQALVAAGDRASALTAGEAYSELVQRELGVDPDPSIAEYVASMRRGVTPAQVRPVGGKAAITGAADGAELAEAAAQTPRQSGGTSDEAAATRSPRGGRNLLIRVALALMAIAVTIVLSWRGRAPTSPRSIEIIAVFPFIVSGGPESQYLGNGLVDLLSASLDGAGSIHVVDPRALLGWLEARQVSTPTPLEAGNVASRFGAGRYVLGSVTGSGSRLRPLAALYQHDPDTVIATAVTEGSAADLFRLVDELTSQLLAASLTGPRHRLTRVAALTTASLPALKSYLAGEEDLRTGRYVEAADEFLRAVQMDSGFALAYYRLAIAADWLGRDSLARSAGEAALKRAARLSEHDSLLVNAAVAVRHGALPEAERLYRRIVIDYPDDLEAWHQLGDLLFHLNPLRGRSASEAKGAFARVLALDPSHEEALLHLARIGSLEGNRVAVDSLAARLMRGNRSTEVLELRAFRAFALSDRDSWKRVTRELLVRPPDVPPVTALQVALFLDDLDGAEQFATILTDARYANDVRGLGYRLQARAAAARGQWDLARARLDSAQRFTQTSTLELRSLLASMEFLEVPLDQVRAIRSEVERWDVHRADSDADPHSAGHVGLHTGIRIHRLGLLSSRLGDRRSATAFADTLERAAARMRGRSGAVFATLAHSLRARIAFDANDHSGALRHLGEANWLPIESGFEEEAGDRYLRANVLEATGKREEALTWYRTIAQRSTHELVYLAPSRIRESMLASEMDDKPGASAAFAVATRLWSDAAPPLRARLARSEDTLRQRGVVITAAGQSSPR
jgi:DNA-binding SARP family transcriptional activator/tetratricopeptide (TPR) repeat protein